MLTPLKNILLKDWVLTHTDELLSWAFYKTSNYELAQDLVQDTFLVASEKFDSFNGTSSSKTWLFSILNHKIVDSYRKKLHNSFPIEKDIRNDFFDSNGGWLTSDSLMDWSSDEGHLLDNGEFHSILKMCLDKLPEKWGLSVRLKYLSGKKGEEICQELDIAPTNLWQMIHRAKLQLRGCINQNWFNN